MPATPREGTAIAGKYVLLERIGAGGIGVVYRAAQPALSRSVAIKLLHPSLVHHAEIVRHFRAEAIAASRFAHPNTVMVIDSGTADDGTPFIVMEEVRGDTLRAVLAREGTLPVGRAVGLVRQILDGLGEAHRAAVVHADIKPDNVLVVPARDGERIKIVDFGLAELARNPRVPTGVGDRGAEWTVAGTPEYMAPEVIQGAPPTPAADLYAVGVVLYELLTGATPFAGGTGNEIMNRHLRDAVVPPSLRRPELGTRLEAAVMRALARRPAIRFFDAAAFSAALDHALAVDPPGDARCEACGEAAARAARFCAGCGIPFAHAAARPGAAEASTAIVRRRLTHPRTSRRDHALARGSSPREGSPPSGHADQLRRRIGIAIARGDSHAIARGYASLARALVGERRVAEARRELEEGIDLLTAGAGQPDRGPACELELLRATLTAPHRAPRSRRDR